MVAAGEFINRNRILYELQGIGAELNDLPLL